MNKEGIKNNIGIEIADKNKDKKIEIIDIWDRIIKRVDKIETVEIIDQEEIIITIEIIDSLDNIEIIDKTNLIEIKEIIGIIEITEIIGIKEIKETIEIIEILEAEIISIEDKDVDMVEKVISIIKDKTELYKKKIPILNKEDKYKE